MASKRSVSNIFVTQLEVPFAYCMCSPAHPRAKPILNCHLNRYHHHRRVAPLSSQMTLLQSFGCVRGLVAHPTLHLQKYVYTLMQSKAIYRHAQIYLPSHFRVIFLLLLFSISPNSCSGGCTICNPQSQPYPQTNPVVFQHRCSYFSPFRPAFPKLGTHPLH